MDRSLCPAIFRASEVWNRGKISPTPLRYYPSPTMFTRHVLTSSKPIADEAITHWDTDPDLCRSLAFLRAHAGLLRVKTLLPAHA